MSLHFKHTPCLNASFFPYQKRLAFAKFSLPFVKIISLSASLECSPYHSQSVPPPHFFFFFLRLILNFQEVILPLHSPFLHPSFALVLAFTFWGPQHGILPPQHLLHSLINVTSPNCDLVGWRQEFGVGVIFISGSPMPTPFPEIICFHTCLLNDKTNDWLIKTQITGWERKDKNALK